jgi:micrococcal nuclease
MNLFSCFCKTKSSASTSISYLTDASWENTTAFVPPITSGKVIKVYDGDTITIAAKLPHDSSPVYRFPVRLLGIDTPEIKGANAHEKELAKKARDALSSRILGKIVYLEDISTEKYGRLLATVFYENTNMNNWMLDQKHAVPYDGGTKLRPDEWTTV